MRFASVCVYMCSSRLMQDHLVEGGFGNTIFHIESVDLCCTVSREKGEMEGGREAEIVSYFPLR